MSALGQGPPLRSPLVSPSEGILSFLKNSKPGDALCVLGLTLSDLYPCEAWSFTFGTSLPGHGEPAPPPGHRRGRLFPCTRVRGSSRS